MSEPKSSNVFWGLALIFTGILLIMDKMGIIDFRWVRLFQLWPVVFVFWGLSLIPINTWIKLIINIIIFALCLYFLASDSLGAEFGDSPFPWV